mmetsp:Transcript_19515/g.17282  ORF Transcript_19515/g.17282 Transcript_19515/m.17282 type:complete len:114 (+) Transcript_19515:2277-2618(+)
MKQARQGDLHWSGMDKHNWQQWQNNHKYPVFQDDQIRYHEDNSKEDIDKQSFKVAPILTSHHLLNMEEEKMKELDKDIDLNSSEVEFKMLSKEIKSMRKSKKIVKSQKKTYFM